MNLLDHYLSYVPYPKLPNVANSPIDAQFNFSVCLFVVTALVYSSECTFWGGGCCLDRNRLYIHTQSDLRIYILSQIQQYKCHYSSLNRKLSLLSLHLLINCPHRVPTHCPTCSTHFHLKIFTTLVLLSLNPHPRSMRVSAYCYQPTLKPLAPLTDVETKSRDVKEWGDKRDVSQYKPL